MARLELPDFEVALAGQREPSSSTIAAVGGYVLVLTTTLPERAIGVTSCYLGRLDGAISATHLQLGPDRQEHHTYRLLAAEHATSTHANRCLLDHASELKDRIAELVGGPVAIDVGGHALERAASAWGPPHPHRVTEEGTADG